MVLMWEEIFEQPDIIESCLEKNMEVIREVINEIEKKNINSVVIAARGTSDHAAVYAKYVIELETGIPVALAAPSIFTMYNKNLQMKNTLLIGISQSGKAADVLEVIKAANEQGALTVSITNFQDSPMALEAKYHLYCNAGLEKSVAATKTFTSELYLIAMLTAEWAKDEKLKKDLSEVPTNMRKLFETADIIKETAARYRYMDECFVLARGVNYSIALESALKIQETTYARAKAYATSDFYHGPYAMIQKDMPVIVFAPEGPSLKDTTEMIKKLKQSEAELLIVSNKKEMLEMGVCSFQIPETKNDMISPFYNVVVAQMFACQLSLVKGLNPDSPRSLSKVTITK